MAKKLELHNAGKASASKRRGARKPGRKKGSDNAGRLGGYQQKIPAKKIAEGNKKNGCSPRLFMLLLPFMAVGGYLFLRS